MKVALCHPTFWPEVRRGAERFTREVADGLAARGHTARIVTSHPGATTRALEDGVEVVRLRRPPGSARMERRLFEPHVASIPFVYRELMRGEDDVVQAMQATDAVAAARWSERTGRPSVFAYMGIPHRAALVNRRLRAATMVRAVHGTTAVTALSEWAAAGFDRWLGVQARVVHPPVDVEFWQVGEERTEEVTIVCAADAREPRKRVELLVEALAVVRRSHPRARLLLDARSATDFSGAEGVELVAMDEREALRSLYQSAWVSALPAWGEAFGLVLAEALACGTPVVGADLHGIPEVLGGDERVGRLFSGDQSGALARALLGAIELTQDPATRTACRARAERFSSAACAEAYEALYLELAAR